MFKKPRTWAVGAALLLALLVMVGLTWANHRYILQASGENSFIAGWLGTRLLLTKGWNPYSEQTTVEIQRHPANLPARRGDKPEAFLHPFYSALVFGPFALTADSGLARTAWMTMLELALFATLAASISLSRWRIPAWALVLLVLFLPVWYYGLRAVSDGDIVVLVAFFMAATLLAIRAEQDTLAGFLLIFVTLKPPAALVFIICLLIWAAISDRWGVVWVFLGGLVLIIAASSLFSPAWTVDFVKQIIRHTRQFEINSLSSLLVSWLPGVGRQLSWVFSAGTILLLVFEWRRAIGKDMRWFYWTACLTLAVTPLAGLPVNLNDYVIMLPALVLIMTIWDERWKIIGRVSIILSLIILSVGIWWLLFAGLQQGMPPDLNPWLVLILPAFMLAGLYWVRWWAIRPARLPLQELSEHLAG